MFTSILSYPWWGKGRLYPFFIPLSIPLFALFLSTPAVVGVIFLEGGVFSTSLPCVALSFSSRKGFSGRLFYFFGKVDGWGEER